MRLQTRTTPRGAWREWVCPGCIRDARRRRKGKRRPAGDRKAAAARWCRAYKRAKGCSRCGFRDPQALDFHHPDPSLKGTAVSFLVQRGRPLKIIVAEANKCVVLCANCHRVEHGEDQRAVENFSRGTAAGCFSGRTPKLCLHKASGLGYVTDPRTRRERYFGPWEDPATAAAYQGWVRVFEAGQSTLLVGYREGCSSGELAALLLVEAAARTLTDSAPRLSLRDASEPLIALRKALETLDEVRENLAVSG